MRWLLGGVVALAMFPCRAAIAFPHSTLKLSEYQKQDWQVEDGLRDNNIRMIAQSPDDTLILATGSGLASFDGTRFRNLPVESDGVNGSEAVSAILLGPGGEMWIGTDGQGLLHRTATATVNISEQGGRYNERIRNLFRAPDGAIWIATQNGIERYSHERLEAVEGCGMISGDITTIFAEDEAGGMFFVTSQGLYHWRNGVARRMTLNLAAKDAPVAIYRDPERRLWVGTMSQVLQLVPRAAGDREFETTFLKQTVKAQVPSPVTILLGDAEGSLWIGTRHEGLFRLAGEEVSRWGQKDGLSDESIRSLFFDKEQNLWIGMLAGGLSRWRRGALAPFGAAEGFNANYAANSLADSRGDLWLGTWGKGLFRLHQGRLTPVTLPHMPIATPIRALAEDAHGSIWVGTWFRGVYKIDGPEVRHYLLGNESPGNAVSVILPERAGGLWIGTYTGLYFYASGVPEPGKGTELLPAQLITCLLQDTDGTVLVGTSKGLYRIRGGVAESVPGMMQHYVLSLFQDRRGYTWAGTRAGGVFHVGAQRATRLPTESGLPELSVNTGSEDQDGHLWLGTTGGILRLSVAEMHDVADGRATQLTTVLLGKADGMRSSECGGPSKPSSTTLRDGTLWFATAKGFVHTTEAAETLGKTTTVASIKGWSTSSDPNGPVQGRSSSPRVELEPGQPDVLLFYNANLLSNPDQVEYRYRLVPYDSQWTQTHSHVARYRRLPPGTYHFEVQSRISGEPWTSPIETVAVHQRPFIYQTVYFQAGVALLVALAGFQLYRRRVQRIKGRMGIVLEERNRIASDCHDSLMAGFAAVSWQLEATAKLFRDSDAASTPAAQSCELARNMVTHCQAEARRIIWDLRNVDEVTSLLSQALERMLSSSPARQEVEFNLAVEGEEQLLPPNSIHHLVCIAQEAVSNAMRHAAPKHVEIQLRYEPESVRLSIHDDGRGFAVSEMDGPRQGHFGIEVMAERARKLGGALQIKSQPDIGTEVAVFVSFVAKGAAAVPAQQGYDSAEWIGI